MFKGAGCLVEHNMSLNSATSDDNNWCLKGENNQAVSKPCN